MRDLLGDEYPEFERSLGERAVRGIRVNESKISVEKFLGVTSLTLTPISYTKDGFIPKEDELGKSPEHHAGMFYVQDPGAMATVNALDIGEGWCVLDACAAPGGKSSQLASKIGDGGFLFANEYLPRRAKIIVGNLERLGVRNAVVTSLDTKEFPRMFSAVFDLVLCDAPCSGEGMFRKYESAVSEWSEENVLLCSKRQKEILANCAPLVKAGGYLLYSTCTYSKEENEDVISDFISKHPDFFIVPVKEELAKATKGGVVSPGEQDALSLSRRFYPHVSGGEGQYVALLKRDENIGVLPTIFYKNEQKTPSKEECAIVNKFFVDNLSKIPEGRLIKQGNGIALVTHDFPIPKSSVFMAGVMLGEIRKGIFFPHHQLFSAYGKDFIRQENLERGDARWKKYLFGEEIPTSDPDMQGYVAILYEGVALGGGKASGGTIKNHYPKGLRNNR